MILIMVTFSRERIMIRKGTKEEGGLLASMMLYFLSWVVVTWM